MLADSQLLFWKDDDRLVLERIRAHLGSSNPSAAYVGASNGDNPEFYSIFQAAMAQIELSSHRMIPSTPSDEDRRYLESADLILLAGGEVARGWEVFETNGIKELISQKRYDGTVLVGVSAGAVQFGLGSLLERSTMRKLSLFQFAPFYVSTHDEENDWWELRALVNMTGNGAKGIGIPAGGGMIYSPDGLVEPIRKTLVEFSRQCDRISEQPLATRKNVAFGSDDTEGVREIPLGVVPPAVQRTIYNSILPGSRPGKRLHK